MVLITTVHFFLSKKCIEASNIAAEVAETAADADAHKTVAKVTRAYTKTQHAFGRTLYKQTERIAHNTSRPQHRHAPFLSLPALTDAKTDATIRFVQNKH